MKALLLLIALALHLSHIEYIELRGVQQDRYDQPVGEIQGTTTVGQTFIARNPNLARVDVLLGTYARENTQEVIFHLRELKPSLPEADAIAESADLTRIVINAADVEDNAYHSFKFPPIEDAQGKAYYFFIESPTSSPGDAITAWSSSRDAYLAGRMYMDGLPQAGDLTFRTFSREQASPEKIWTIFSEQFFRDKPAILNLRFYEVLIFSYLVLPFLSVALVIREV